MAKDPIKKAENGTYYFRANLGFHPITGKQIQKYKSGFKTKKEAREAYSKLMLASTEAVSYTHLDVYKRQVVLWQGRNRPATDSTGTVQCNTAHPSVRSKSRGFGLFPLHL